MNATKKMGRAEQGEEVSRRRMVTRSMGARVKLRKLGELRSRQPSLLSLPLELQLEILARLGPVDLLAVRRVCTRLATAALHPSLWKEIEVLNDEKTTDQVVGELRAMSQLKKITIHYRRDIHHLLRQIARSNTSLEYLFITNYRGYCVQAGNLNSASLCRIVKNCPRLHSLVIVNIKFRGTKLFERLGQMGGRLKNLSALMQTTQFVAFANQLSLASPRLREFMLPWYSRRLWNRWYLTYYSVNECSPYSTHLYIDPFVQAIK